MKPFMIRTVRKDGRIQRINLAGQTYRDFLASHGMTSESISQENGSFWKECERAWEACEAPNLPKKPTSYLTHKY